MPSQKSEAELQRDLRDHATWVQASVAMLAARDGQGVKAGGSKTLAVLHSPRPSEERPDSFDASSVSVRNLQYMAPIRRPGGARWTEAPYSARQASMARNMAFLTYTVQVRCDAKVLWPKRIGNIDSDPLFQ